jgi:hypothetical protein
MLEAYSDFAHMNCEGIAAAHKEPNRQAHNVVLLSIVLEIPATVSIEKWKS